MTAVGDQWRPACAKRHDFANRSETDIKRAGRARVRFPARTQRPFLARSGRRSSGRLGLAKRSKMFYLCSSHATRPRHVRHARRDERVRLSAGGGLRRGGGAAHKDRIRRNVRELERLQCQLLAQHRTPRASRVAIAEIIVHAGACAQMMRYAAQLAVVFSSVRSGSDADVREFPHIHPGAPHRALRPPSQGITAPVVHRASSDRSQSAARAISAGWAM